MHGSPYGRARAAYPVWHSSEEFNYTVYCAFWPVSVGAVHSVFIPYQLWLAFDTQHGSLRPIGNKKVITEDTVYCLGLVSMVLAVHG